MILTNDDVLEILREIVRETKAVGIAMKDVKESGDITRRVPDDAFGGLIFTLEDDLRKLTAWLQGGRKTR